MSRIYRALLVVLAFEMGAAAPLSAVVPAIGSRTIFSAIFLRSCPSCSSVFPGVVSGVGVSIPDCLLAGWARSLVPIVSRLSRSNGVPILCYVTDRRAFSKDHELDAREALLHKIQEAAAAGVDWIQVREKDLSGKECAALTSAAIERVARRSPRSRVRLAFS